MSSCVNKSFNKLLKENAELRKELKFYKELHIKRKEFKSINIKNSYNSFYSTREWKELRYKVLMKHKLQKGSICMLCNKQSNKLHVDHIIPRSKRPDLELVESNLQVMCPDCNIER